MAYNQATERPRSCFLALVLASAAFLLVACGRSTEPASPAASAPAYNTAAEYRTVYMSLSGTLVEQLNRSSQLATNLEAHQVAIDRLIWVTGLQPPVWQVDYSIENEELPHLVELRTLARLLSAYAKKAIRQGAPDAGAGAIAALVRMSGHVGGKCVAEAVMAFAIMMVGAELVEEHAAELGGSRGQVVLAEFRKVDALDPFGGNAMLAWELARTPEPEAAAATQGLFQWGQESAMEGRRRSIELLER